MKFLISFISITFYFSSSSVDITDYKTITPQINHVPAEIATTVDHKYYISVSNVKYSDKAQSLQMVTRFFIDDLQEVLNTRYDTQITLGIKAEVDNHHDTIQRYLNKKLSISVKGQQYSPQLLGAEYDKDQIVLYIEFNVGALPLDIDMNFSAFFELFEDQKNLVHFKINDQRKTLVLERAKPTDRVKF